VEPICTGRRQSSQATSYTVFLSAQSQASHQPRPHLRTSNLGRLCSHRMNLSFSFTSSSLSFSVVVALFSVHPFSFCMVSLEIRPVINVYNYEARIFHDRIIPRILQVLIRRDHLIIRSPTASVLHSKRHSLHPIDAALFGLHLGLQVRGSLNNDLSVAGGGYRIGFEWNSFHLIDTPKLSHHFAGRFSPLRAYASFWEGLSFTTHIAYYPCSRCLGFYHTSS
jgi:hypothetical protein